MREIQTVSDGSVYLLSPAEKKILEVICEAEGPLSTTQICERAGCTTRTYRNFMNRPNFRALLQPALNYMVERSLLDIFGSLIQNAKAGRTKSQELLFKTIGLLKENYPSIVNIFNIGVDEGFLTEAEIDSLLGKGRNAKKN